MTKQKTTREKFNQVMDELETSGAFNGVPEEKKAFNKMFKAEEKKSGYAILLTLASGIVSIGGAVIGGPLAMAIGAGSGIVCLTSIAATFLINNKMRSIVGSLGIAKAAFEDGLNAGQNKNKTSENAKEALKKAKEASRGTTRKGLNIHLDMPKNPPLKKKTGGR